MVNGLELPDSFVRLIDRPKPLIHWTPKGGEESWLYRGGEGGLYWIAKGDAESYDSLNGLQLAASLAAVQTETNGLPVSFHLADYLSEEIEKANAKYAHLPGWLPFITDFSQIVYLGWTGGGEACCFDYRENRDEPSIIHWNDAYWRRMAPDFDTFIGWYDVSVRTLFRHWIKSTNPTDLGKPAPEGMEGRKCLRLNQPSVREMAGWSQEQPEDEPLNLLFVTVQHGLLYLFAIDTKEDMLLLEEHFQDLRRELATE